MLATPPATLTPFPFLKRVTCMSTSGPLHWLLPLPGVLFSPMPSLLTPQVILPKHLLPHLFLRSSAFYPTVPPTTWF